LDVKSPGEAGKFLKKGKRKAQLAKNKPGAKKTPCSEGRQSASAARGKTITGRGGKNLGEPKHNILSY